MTAGYPEIESLSQQIKLLDNYAIDFIEIGVAFSDPLANGHVIQKTSEIAISKGMNLSILFDRIDQIETKTPLALMGYIYALSKDKLRRLYFLILM
ncbi:MAG: tryptophan synthase subunit alpha [Crocinitomicaceae bacterium]